LAQGGRFPPLTRNILEIARMQVTPEELSKIRALPSDLARRCVQHRRVGVTEGALAAGCTPVGPAWDHPLSLSDVRRRLALQCVRLRATAGGQAREAERTAQAARELALEHKVVCGQVAELQQRLEIASEDAASSRREVDWLRRVLEAAVGLREASITMNEHKEFRQQEPVKPAEPTPPAPEPQKQKKENSGDDSETELQRTQEAAEKHVARANRQTQLRRARRRQCRLRRAAEEAAKAAMLADPQGAATLQQLSEDGALPTMAGSDAAPAMGSPGRVVPARTGLTTPRGTPSVSRRESLLGQGSGQMYEHDRPMNAPFAAHHPAAYQDGGVNGTGPGFYAAHAVELANVPTAAHVPASFVKSLKEQCGVPRVAAAIHIIPMASRRGA